MGNSWPRQRKPQAVVGNPDTQTVWVAEQWPFQDLPAVTQYEALVVHRKGGVVTGITALVRNYKQVIRITDHRRFFAEREQLQAYLLTLVNRALEKHTRAAEKLQQLLQAEGEIDSKVSVEVVPRCNPVLRPPKL